MISSFFFVLYSVQSSRDFVSFLMGFDQHAIPSGHFVPPYAMVGIIFGQDYPAMFVCRSAQGIHNERYFKEWYEIYEGK